MSDAAELVRAFQRRIDEAVGAPLRAHLDAYVTALEEPVERMRALAGGDHDGRSGGTAGTGEGEENTEDEKGRDVAQRRHRYAERFKGRFHAGLFETASEARDAFFAALDTAPPSGPDETVHLPTEDPAPAAPDPVRPGVWGRSMASIRRGTDREVPVSRLETFYLAELERRLEPVANAVARLGSVAVAEIRWELHEHTELEHDDADRTAPRLGRAADEAAARLDAVLEEVGTEFGQAIRASAVRVPEPGETARERRAARRGDILDGWSGFEQALVANVVSEAVLARGLGAMEGSVVSAARELESIRGHRGAEPLERLADAMAALGDRARSELEGDTAGDVPPALADEAGRVFSAEIPRVRALVTRIEETTARLIDDLAEIPGTVAADLQISEHPVPTIPERPRELKLREAPLEELLNTACGGTLPRWIEGSVDTVHQELAALAEELERARNAVEFQLRAPLRGGFDDTEIRALADGITERTVAQLADLRDQGLTPIDTLVEGLEERARDEAAALRSAVANREFMRIHSEIAEEQAVRQLATGVERLRSAAGAAGRGAGATWDATRRVVTAVRDWVNRQMGVDEVERAEMLESLEQSLLGEDQQVVALPAIYRQLFDVEADVPWDELLVSRDEELAVVRRGYDRWLEDRSATVAIVGEKGSGKTTLLRLAEQQVFGESRIVRTAVGRSVDDPAELLARLAGAFGEDDAEDLPDRINAQEPAVAVVEDLHHLFIRALGGFDALEAFLELVSATRSNVLWVVTMDEFAWRYLSRTVGLAAHFVHKVSTTNLPPDELERAIMARHEVSGFALRFETESEEESRWSRLLGRGKGGELTKKEAHRRRFFRELAGIAEGNIVMALFYWLRSIKTIDEHVLVLGDPEIIQLEFLERLPLAHLHTIAAIILHGGLSEAAHRRVFQLPAVESRLQLASLADAHIIFLSRDGEYKINKVLYRPFIRLLASKNIF